MRGALSKTPRTAIPWFGVVQLRAPMLSYNILSNSEMRKMCQLNARFAYEKPCQLKRAHASCVSRVRKTGARILHGSSVGRLVRV